MKPKVILKLTKESPSKIAQIMVIDETNCKAASIAVDVPSMLLFRAEIIVELFLPI